MERREARTPDRKGVQRRLASAFGALRTRTMGASQAPAPSRRSAPPHRGAKASKPRAQSRRGNGGVRLLFEIVKTELQRSRFASPRRGGPAPREMPVDGPSLVGYAGMSSPAIRNPRSNLAGGGSSLDLLYSCFFDDTCPIGRLSLDQVNELSGRAGAGGLTDEINNSLLYVGQ